MNEIFIGIDPDSNGAVGFIGPDRSIQIASLQFVAPGEVDLSDLRNFIEGCGGPVMFAYIERQRLVFIPPRGGRKSTIAVRTSVTLAKIEWSIRGLLAGLMIPMESLPPGSWKKAFVHGKEAMLPVASRMFPSVVWTGDKLKKEGQATALLLAEWGRRVSVGTPK